MHTPSFSDSDNVSLTEEYKCEEKSDVMRGVESFYPAHTEDKSTQTGTTLETLASRVFRMEDTLRMVYSRVRSTEMICKRNISLILDQSDKHFEKMMLGFRAIQKCWDLSAEAQMQMGEAVDQFKELTGVL